MGPGGPEPRGTWVLSASPVVIVPLLAFGDRLSSSQPVVCAADPTPCEARGGDIAPHSVATVSGGGRVVTLEGPSTHPSPWDFKWDHRGRVLTRWLALPWHWRQQEALSGVLVRVTVATLG